MLKGKITRKILMLLACLFIVFLILIFPTKSKEYKTSSKQIINNEIILYLKDKNNLLVRINVYTNEKVFEKLVEEITNYLTLGTKNANYIKEDFKPIIPSNTKLLSFNRKDDLLVLNFSKELLNIDKDDEERLISGLIYSYTSLDGINKISIYIDGNLLNKMPYSGESLNPLLDRSFGINKTYNIRNLNGSSKTTVYYLTKHDNLYYYTPITYVTDKEKEKLEVIISEMTSKTSYQTNLLSYLKASKNIDYKINSNCIDIIIKKELFNSLNNSNLLETVIYSMNLNIKDNYNIKEVNYLVDDMLYKKTYI